MRSIVFSSFSDKYFEEEIRPKLEELGVEIVSIIRPEEEVYLESDNFDSIIIFQDMTIKSQQDLIKEFAKKCKKPSISLSRRSKNFDNELSGSIKRLSNLVAPSPPVEVAATIKTVINLITDPKSIPIETQQEASSLVQELRKSLEEKTRLIAELSEMIGLYEKDNERLIRELKKQGETISGSITERDLLLAEYNKLFAAHKALIVKLNESINHQNDGNNIRNEIAAIRLLNKEGILSDSEALERLLLIGGDVNAS
jgi:DNA repair exonuclease SbcCD ATPase subunit